MSRPAPAAWVAPLAALVPLGAGVAIMIAAGAPRSRWALHLASGALGLLAYFAVLGACRARRRGSDGAPRPPAPAAAGADLAGWAAIVAALAATLLGEGVEGVRRWIRLGPVLLHPSALLSPLALVLAWRRMAHRPRSTLLALACIQSVHIAQPDAGQATAFGAATLVLLFGRRSRLGDGTAALAALLAAASVGVAWVRPDPLAPAPFVEDIVQRAFGIGRLQGVLALASLIPLVCAPLLVPRASGPPAPSASIRAVLVAYLACSLAVVLVGGFPVPLLGFGSSPVIGALVGLAALRVTGDVDASTERN